MSHDDHLTVSCRCGKISITKLDGYHTSDLLDAADLGVQAERLCRRKRLRKWAWFTLVTMVVCTGLAYGTGWIVGEVGRRRVAEAEQLCRDGERLLQVEHDERAAIEVFTKSLAVKPDVRTLLFRGFCYYRIGEYEKSIADCDEALKMEPGNEAAMKNKELASRYKGDRR